MLSFFRRQLSRSSHRAHPYLAGELLGVNQQLRPEQRDARHILCHVLKQVVAWKKLNTEPEAMVHFKTLNNMPL